MNDIKTSPEFKAQTTKAIVSIAFFALTYIVILILTICITALSIYGGIMLIIAMPRIFTIAVGIGLASFGILILIFLLKFIFKSHIIDRSHLIEINKADEPRLFRLIEEIVNEVHTSFPKKVYLSSDVNAAVFYDSSFWSMLFPIKKNLQIGLGLVNTITETELKAILAHEFGHFSQRTMKVGSYVYNVNQVIFNMLFDNEAYDKLIREWAAVSGYFSIFVMLAVKIIEGIKWVLRKLYQVVNKSYMGLSREMEFHADEIAANVTGYEPLKNSLLRMSLAEHSFNSVLGFYDGKIANNTISGNLYKEQFFVMNFYAESDNISIKNNLPQVTYQDISRYNKSKLVIKDQWASHPGTVERIERLEKTKITSKQINHTSANEVFRNIEETQKRITEKIFKEVQYQGEVTSEPFEEFQSEYRNVFLNNTFSKRYNGYYDNKNPLHFETDSPIATAENLKPDELFSNEQVDVVYTSISLQNDVATLKQIANKEIPIKMFDYDGKKYKRKECNALISKLENELVQINEEIRRNDIRIFEFFWNVEQIQKKTTFLKQLYEDFFMFDKAFDSKYEIYTQLSNELQFVNFTTPIDQIKNNFLKIKPLEERLKTGIHGLLAENLYQTEISIEIRDSLNLFLSQEWDYFGFSQYHNDNLKVLFGALNNYSFLLSKGYFIIKKKILDYQEELLIKYDQHTE